MISLIENRDALVNLGKTINDLEAVNDYIGRLEISNTTAAHIKVLHIGAEVIEVSKLHLLTLLNQRKQELVQYLAGLGINVDY